MAGAPARFTLTTYSPRSGGWNVPSATRRTDAPNERVSSALGNHCRRHDSWAGAAGWAWPSLESWGRNFSPCAEGSIVTS
eukprot:1917058-Prymnesium_polylepis.3